MQVTALCTCVSHAVPLKPEQSLRRTASLKPRRSRRLFSKRPLNRFEQTKTKEVSSELKSQRLSQRRETGGASKRWHWRQGNEVTHTPNARRDHSLGAHFCPFAFLQSPEGCMCRNGQKRPKLRTGPHATTKEGTNVEVHALGRFRVPSRPTARRVECLGISGRRSRRTFMISRCLSHRR